MGLVDAEAKEGQTGLHAAAEGGDTVKLNKLLRALRAVGADIASMDSTDRRLFTPFHVACAGDHAACVRALCAAGSDTAARNDAGQTGWDLATYLERAAVRALPPSPAASPAAGRREVARADPLRVQVMALDQASLDAEAARARERRLEEIGGVRKPATPISTKGGHQSF